MSAAETPARTRTVRVSGRGGRPAWQVIVDGERVGWEYTQADAEREAQRIVDALSTFAAAPDDSIPAALEALTEPTDADRANARRIIAEQRLETLVAALREMVADLRRSAQVGGIGGAVRETCAERLDAILSAHTGAAEERIARDGGGR